MRFMDLQPLERLPDLLGSADLHLLPQRADAADLVMPSKLTGILASGRAVIATAHQGTEIAMVINGTNSDDSDLQRHPCGLVVPPEESQAFADAVIKLAIEPDLRKRFGEAGRRYARRHLDIDEVLTKFVAELEACMR